ncbi:DUF2182 domain-containing protein [Marinoscillum furvescens]|uniref:Putative metal-binding integral membrane protein DUF2182 n=1 Tax=Marinoscillum furvescens DSM 4134 TaxID=1122208 RepID=A0A3D9L6B1_MARFU|nr:DUF2182 domain-containing protein [Marinoscillum furvescens]REE00127.1 putative metal-binding integral membrane protein DUF2182 [Marinoscillum furvescens DSM 4134]
MIRQLNGRHAISVAVFFISGFCWAALLWPHSPTDSMSICLGTTYKSNTALSSTGPALTPSGPLAGWILMVAAMMLPKLIPHLELIYARSLKRRRVELMVLFTMGYLCPWAGLGWVLYYFSPLLSGFQSVSLAVLFGIVALVWQCTPWKQYCLNKSHHHPAIPTFGPAASRETLYYGLSHGGWCVGSGWVLMLFPLTLPAGHLLAMALLTPVMISEHMTAVRPARWQWPLRLKLWKILTKKGSTRALMTSIKTLKAPWLGPFKT